MATKQIFQEVELPEQKIHDDGFRFPAVLTPNRITDTIAVEGFEKAIKAHKPWLESLLQKRGAILFRGYHVSSPSDFNNAVEAFGFPEMLYVGGRVSRTQVFGRVYTTNEYPPEKGIPFHHEMAYLPDFATKLFFFCEEEPQKGGETPIVLSHIIYEKMKEKHPEFVGRVEEHGLTYIRVVSDRDDTSAMSGGGWKSAYKTNDKNVAKERAAKLGTKLEWIENGVKVTTGPVPGVRFDKESGKKTWFNSLVVTYKDHVSEKYDGINASSGIVELGNGEAIPDHIVEDYVKLLEEECVAIPWKKGDVMLISNLMVLHGRRPLLKPPRRILASLCK